MAGYSGFANYYDALTANVDYAGRAESLSLLIRRHAPETELVLDLACGTGSLIKELDRHGFDLTGVDASADMLSIAMQKNQDSPRHILFLNQDMSSLDLYGTVGATVCTLDSVNHVENENKLLVVFKKVSLFTDPGGLFIFDANTEFKHKNILADNVFVYDLPQVFCVWQNSYILETGGVDITLDFFSPKQSKSYVRESESFSEQLYTEPVLQNLLEAAGFSVIQVLDGDSFGERSGESQRLLFVTRKV